MTQRLIETWLPIAQLGIESLRERTPMTPFPAPNRLHVWWARRPLVASRAAILASLLPADADREKFMHVLGIHGDPVAAKKRIAEADRKGERLGADAYGYSRAFSYTPTDDERRVAPAARWHGSRATPARRARPDRRRGSHSVRGDAAWASRRSPTTSILSRPDPSRHDRVARRRSVTTFSTSFSGLARVRSIDRASVSRHFSQRSRNRTLALDGYLWARTITCPYCDGLIPLSPNWRLAPDGTGVRLHPDPHAQALRLRDRRERSRSRARAPSPAATRSARTPAVAASSMATR